MASQMDDDATEWLARWGAIAGRDELTLRVDGGGWRLDPVPAPAATATDALDTISADVRRRPDGSVIARRMTREEVEAFFGPDDGAI